MSDRKILPASEFEWSYTKGYVCLTKDNTPDVDAAEMLKLLEKGEVFLVETEIPVDWVEKFVKANKGGTCDRLNYDFKVSITVEDAQKMLQSYKTVMDDWDDDFMEGLNEKLNRMRLYLEEVHKNQVSRPDIMPSDITTWQEEWNKRISVWEAQACLDTIKYSEHN